MPSLTVETSGVRRGGVITSRVLIGRLPTNGVILAESSVSRLHAWIDCDLDGTYYVADTGSLTGTWVNNKPVDRRQALHDRDVIRVGKTLLTFHETNDLEPDVQPINLAGYPPFEDVDQAGVLFECVCGAPAWFKATAIGQTHKCKQCGRSVTIPDKPGVRAHPIGEPVGTAEAVAAHGLAESYVGEAASAGNDLHRPYDEHGLSDSFGGQTAVAEAEPQTAVHEEHGLAEIQTAPDGDETGFGSGHSFESDPDPVAESATGEDEISFPPEGDEPTLEQMLAPEVETPASSATVPEETISESTSADTGEPAESVQVEDEIPPAAEHATAEYHPETPADLVTATHDELVAPPSDSHDPIADASQPPGRPSLFASRRRPSVEPHQAVAEASSAAPLAVEQGTAFESPAAIAEAGPLDAFDDYAGDEPPASAATLDAPSSRPHAPSDAASTQMGFAPSDEEAAGAQTCSVCHTAIIADEATTTCPSCGLTFHAECWNENQGCSAYGCPHVGALAPKEQPQAVEQAVVDGAAPYDAAEPDEPFPWEYLYLAASIVGTLMGLLVFGVPALIAALGTLVYKIRFPDPARRNGVVTLAILLAILGIGLGIVASIYWWFGGFSGLNWGRLRGK